MLYLLLETHWFFWPGGGGRRDIFHVQNLSVSTGLMGNLPFSSCISLYVFGCKEQSFNYLVTRRLNEGCCAKVVKKVFSFFGSFTQPEPRHAAFTGKGDRDSCDWLDSVVPPLLTSKKVSLWLARRNGEWLGNK